MAHDHALQTAKKFLDGLPFCDSFERASNYKYQHEIPSDWTLFITDVKNSTKAVEAGRYRDVNIAGAGGIMAVLNACQKMEIPFTFGGDGAIFLIPAPFVDAVTMSLQGCQKIAREQFQFELRVGRIPISDLKAEGHSIRITRFKLSTHLAAFALSGSGMIQADIWIRDEARAGKYLVTEPQVGAKANVDGLECRWNPIHNRNGEIATLVIQVRDDAAADAGDLYEAIAKEITQLFPNSSPVTYEQLKLSRRFGRYLKEGKARGITSTKGLLRYGLTNYVLTMGFDLLTRLGLIKAGKRYMNEVVANSEYRKFDGMLRMVLDGDISRVRQLERLLEKRRDAGEIFFGLHHSSTAVMTCLILDRSAGNHLHLMDGGEGGYTLAAKSLKAQRAASAKARKAG